MPKPNLQYTASIVIAVITTACVVLLVDHADQPAVRVLCAVGLILCGMTVMTMIAVEAIRRIVADAAESVAARLERVETATHRMADTEHQVLTALTSEPAPAESEKAFRFLN